jgi:hypothetical protein
MYELVRFKLSEIPLWPHRLPSFAGSGLPERIRSTTFALLGLTAAAGLSLVAIFAQPDWPLLSPAPLPNSPAQKVREAVVVDHGTSGFGPAAGSSVGSNVPAKAAAPRRGAGSRGDHAASGQVGAPAAVPTPAPGGVDSDTNGSAAPAASPPVTTPAPQPSAAPSNPSAETTAPSPVEKRSSNGSSLPGHGTASASSSSSGHGKSATAPGQTGTAGKSASAPGQTGTAGKSATAPPQPQASSASQGNPPSTPPGLAGDNGNGKGNGQGQ